MKVINNLYDLRESKFGRPSPRHGLQLLYWFSREYIDVDVYSLMTPKLGRPQTGAFGFRLFHNKEGILPKQNLPYYEVGNLHGYEPDKLPQYVRLNYTHHCDESNKDRIIISLNGSNIQKVYVTEHMDQRNFNPNQTYEVSVYVIKQIRGMELKQFLQSCNNNQSKPTNQTFTIDMPESEHSNHRVNNPGPNTSRCWCTIL